MAGASSETHEPICRCENFLIRHPWTGATEVGRSVRALPGGPDGAQLIADMLVSRRRRLEIEAARHDQTHVMDRSARSRTTPTRLRRPARRPPRGSCPPPPRRAPGTNGRGRTGGMSNSSASARGRGGRRRAFCTAAVIRLHVGDQLVSAYHGLVPQTHVSNAAEDGGEIVGHRAVRTCAPSEAPMT